MNLVDDERGVSRRTVILYASAVLVVLAACFALDQLLYHWVHDGDTVYSRWPISARGCSW